MQKDTYLPNTLNKSHQQLTDGLIIADKPCGYTSFDVTRVVSKSLGIKKVGHSGTLDKDATGLMIIAFGKATKLLTYLIGLDKRYIGQVKFGTATDTDDAAGSVTNCFDGIIDPAKCIDALKSQVGLINQLPPNYSSLHIGGKRAYQIARSGQSVELKPRQIEIYSLDVIACEQNIFTIDVRCSSGTYIRSIARDAGLATGYFAHLCSLRRMSIAEFNIDHANSIDKIKSGEIDILSPMQAVSSIGIPIMDIEPQYAADFRNGKKLSANIFRTPLQCGKSFVRCENELLGMINNENGIQYEFVY